VRALETARIIGDACDLVAETEAVFREIGRPDRMNGQLLMNVTSFWFYTRWYLGLTRDEEGSESYKQVRERVRAAQTYLEALPNDARVVVVTHSVFIIFFVAHMCNQRAMGPLRALRALYRIARIKNGSITQVTLNSATSKGQCSFILG
jgi:broad specificity phosphatase PhoE